MGYDWEEILGAEGDDMQDAYDSLVWEAEALMEEPCNYVEPPYDGPEWPGTSPIPESHVQYEWKGQVRVVPREWGGHEFTTEEIELMLSGREITFEDQRRDGVRFRASGRLNRDLQVFEGLGEATMYTFSKSAYELIDSRSPNPES